MKIVAIIPARLASSRFPNKLLKPLGNKTVLAHTYENAVQSNLFSEVIVATDSLEIQKEILRLNGRVVLTGEHETGSDRIAEASEQINADIFVNIQGDEPFLYKKPLEDLIKVFESDIHEDISVASLKIRLTDAEDIHNPNNVKVICDQDGNALYFSRLPIPYDRDKTAHPLYYKHIGVYAFRKSALQRFAKIEMGPLEIAEKIEAIRFLENKMKIKMIETEFVGVGIDVPEDLEKAQKILQNYTLY